MEFQFNFFPPTIVWRELISWTDFENGLRCLAVDTEEHNVSGRINLINENCYCVCFELLFLSLA